MAEQNTVTVKFEGDSKSLTQAIKQLDDATKKLLNTQSKIRDFNERIVKSNNKNKNSLKNLRVQLQLQNQSLKDLKIPLETYKKALGGSRLAIAQIRQATKKHIRDLKKQRKGILDTEHGTRILGGSFAVLRSKMLLASFGAGLFSASILKLTKLFGEQEKAEKKLETALGRHSKTLLAFASAQQKVTTFGDEETIVAMSLLGAYTDNEKAIARLTRASMDLASAKGMDLNSAVDLVSKSVFSSTNALSRYGIAIEGTEGSVKRLESATKAISALYSGQAEASAETFLGSMTQLGNSVGDLGERFGSILAPSVMVGAKALKVFADNIDTEEIKAYGTALVGTSVAYVTFTKGTVIATKAMALFNKVSKKNIAILAGMIAIGAVIDKLNLFKDASSDLSGELEDLNGQIENLNSKSELSSKKADKLIESTNKLLIAENNYGKLQAEQLLIEQDRLALKQKYTVALEGEQPVIEQSIDYQIENNELRTRQILLERELTNAKLSSTSTLLGGLASLNQATKGNAKVSKKIAQAQAIIDTYAGANKALASAPPPFNFIAMAGVIAQGIANVAQIQAQKFEQGGLVGGRRHSQGGTMIEAERGEFVMSRNAVQSIGVETLNQMNQNGSRGRSINVNINGNVIGNESFVRDTLIPEINKTLRQGLA